MLCHSGCAWSVCSNSKRHLTYAPHMLRERERPWSGLATNGSGWRLLWKRQRCSGRVVGHAALLALGPHYLGCCARQLRDASVHMPMGRFPPSAGALGWMEAVVHNMRWCCALPLGTGACTVYRLPCMDGWCCAWDCACWRPSGRSATRASVPRVGVCADLPLPLGAPRTALVTQRQCHWAVASPALLARHRPTVGLCRGGGCLGWRHCPEQSACYTCKQPVSLLTAAASIHAEHAQLGTSTS